MTPDDDLHLTVDERNHVRGVRLARLPDVLRDVEALRDAVDRAHRAAILRRAAEDRPGHPERDGRRVPTAARVTLPPRRTLDNIMTSGRTFDPRAHLRAHRPTGGPRTRDTGTSDNGCVTVVLHLAGPTADLDIDQGWLRQATASQVGSALTTAFDRAYHSRETT